MTKRQVQRCVRGLEKAGEVEVLRNQGRRGSNIYRILLPNTESNGDAHVIGDAGVAKAVTSASPTRDATVAQSVNEPKTEPTPIVPEGDEVDFWVRICLDCFRQPYRRVSWRVLHKLARDVPGLDKKHAKSLLKFYRSEEVNSRQPPFNSRRHSPERLILDLPRQLALAVQEYPPAPPPKAPAQGSFTVEDVREYLVGKYGDCRLPRSLAELHDWTWESMREEILEAMRMKKSKPEPRK